MKEGHFTQQTIVSYPDLNKPDALTNIPTEIKEIADFLYAGLSKEFGRVFTTKYSAPHKFTNYLYLDTLAIAVIRDGDTIVGASVADSVDWWNKSEEIPPVSFDHVGIIVGEDGDVENLDGRSSWDQDLYEKTAYINYLYISPDARGREGAWDLSYAMDEQLRTDGFLFTAWAARSEMDDPANNQAERLQHMYGNQVLLNQPYSQAYEQYLRSISRHAVLISLYPVVTT